MPRFPGNKLPTSPAVRLIEHEMGFDHANNPPSLFDFIAPEQLNDPVFMRDFLTGLVTERVINILRTEHGMEIQEEPEGVESGHNPGPIRDQFVPVKRGPPTFQELGNLVVGSGI